MKQHRKTLTLGILAAWLAGFGALAWREASRGDDARLAEIAMRITPGATFYAVHQGAEQIGFASSTIDTTARGLEMTDLFVADMPVGGTLHRASLRSVVHLTRGLALDTFSIDFLSGAGNVKVSGGRADDSTLVLVIASEGAKPDTQRVAARGPIFTPTLIPLAVMLAEEPEVGATRRLMSFDPIAMRPREVTVRIAAESLFTLADSARLDRAKERWSAARTDTVRAWRLETEGDAPARLAGWVDAQGRLVRVTQAGDLAMQRMAYELAYENWRLDRRARQARAATKSGDIFESTAIAANAPLARGRRERLTVRLSGVALAGFDLDGGRQRLAGDTLRIAVEPASALRAAYSLPTAPDVRARHAASLKDEPMLMLGEPPIRRLAHRLRGDERDPRVVAERIHRWVRDSIAKRMTFGVPNAAQVLASRTGDCNEHTQLYVALARQAGIPARTVAGLAWMRGKFYYHAWPEVFLGDWVAVDPTFGEFPADAAHLRFVSGGLDRQAELLRLIGNLDIDVVR